jgi:hypothetical protein
MKTRILMSLSAAFYATLGVGITFLPQELLAHVGARSEGTPVLLMQMLGALFLGFAILNWMNRGNRIGGIYGRPVSMANFFNFAVGGLALLKGSIAQQYALDVTIMATIYTVFGVWFGLALFTHPANETATGADR